MNFEFMYSFCGFFLIFVAEFLSLKWIETKEIQQIEKYLKLQTNPLFIGAGIIYAYLMVFHIPKHLGFEFSSMGTNVAALLLIIWYKKEREPRHLILKRRVNQAEMEKRGAKGLQMADLKVRYMSDYLSTTMILTPYLMLLAVGLILLNWAPTQPDMQVENEQAYSIGFLFLLVGLGVTLLLNWQMQKLLKEPLDLQSSEPQEFIKKIHLYLRDRLRIFLMIQISFVALMLMFIPSHVYGLSYKYEIGAAGLYLIVTACMVFLVRKIILRLEEQRWQEISND